MDPNCLRIDDVTAASCRSPTPWRYVGSSFDQSGPSESRIQFLEAENQRLAQQIYDRDVAESPRLSRLAELEIENERLALQVKTLHNAPVSDPR